MYIIHLVLTCPIGLFLRMPVDLLVSEGINGFLLRCCCPLFWAVHQWLVTCLCRVPLPHVDYRLETSSSQSIISGKEHFWRCLLNFFFNYYYLNSSDAFISKEVILFILLQWKWMCMAAPTFSLMMWWTKTFNLWGKNTAFGHNCIDNIFALMNPRRNLRSVKIATSSKEMWFDVKTTQCC